MNTQELFPFIEHIRKNLWCNRDIGKVSLMVGSGFSRNAEKLLKDNTDTPLLKEIALSLFKELYSQKEMEKDYYVNLENDLTHVSNIPKLANEYEITFGTSKLESLLINLINDNSFIPGELHKKLLKLPWSDVFTTNYDTLLERASESIYEKNYEIVRNISDISNKQKPRIVKLHGSFPSDKPYIITEEHYRKYTKEFAPFVNLVQQSLMENIFCLIGFSGDDPNFLQWIGWVRDNLGKFVQPIYLVGLLELSISQRKFLEYKNIRIIDLSELFPAEKYKDRHKAALEWFLLNISIPDIPNSLINTWPNVNVNKNSNDNLPELVCSSKIKNKTEEIYFDHHKNINDEVKKVINDWKETRQNYLGWIVCPKENRNTLWNNTKYFIYSILPYMSSIESPNDLIVIYELLWRLDRAMIPLFLSWINYITPVIEKYNPYPDLCEIENSKISPINENNLKIDWADFSKYWVEIVFWIIREARDDQELERFNHWIEKLKNIKSLNLEWESIWFYEQCLFYLNRVEFGKVKELLKEWNIDNQNYYWSTKISSILSEIGDYDRANNILNNSLQQIRATYNFDKINYKNLSQEGWIVFLLDLLNYRNYNFKRDETVERFRELSKYKCSPWDEFQDIDNILSGSLTTKNNGTKKKNNFDPHMTTITRFIGYQDDTILSDVEVRAFNFIRIFEEAGIPVSLDYINLYSQLFKKAINHIEIFAPFWCYGLLLRKFNIDLVDEKISREFISFLKQDKVDLYFQLLLKTLNELLSESKINENKTIQVIELLSRFCIRVKFEFKENLLNVSFDLFNNETFKKSHRLSSSLCNLFGRIIISMDNNQQKSIVLKLINLPIPGVNNFIVISPYNWVEPILFIEKSIKFPKVLKLSIKQNFGDLIKLALNDNSEVRKKAIIRLYFMHSHQLLAKSEKIKFINALWNKLDKKNDLPIDTNFLDCSFIALSIGNNGVKILKNYLIKNAFPRIINISNGSRSLAIGGNQNSSYTYNLISSSNSLDKVNFISWNIKEIEFLVIKGVEWWNSEKNEIEDEKSEGYFYNELKTEFNRLAIIYSEILLPNLKSDTKLKKSIKQLYNGMYEKGLNVVEFATALLFIGEITKNEVAKVILFNINDTENEKIISACNAIYLWYYFYNKGKLSKPTFDFINDVCDKIISTRNPGLENYLDLVILFLKKNIIEKSKTKEIKLLTALELLFIETEYENIDLFRLRNQEFQKIPFDKISFIRASSSNLALELFKKFTKRKTKIPDILLKWKKRSIIDPLPEIRNPWINLIPKISN